MPIERQPINPISKGTPVPSSTPHKIRDGESWATLASIYNTTPRKLIYANFRTLDPAEINWYLHHNVGCQLTADGRNRFFSSAASPGIIYIPFDMSKFELPPEVSIVLNGGNPEVVNLPLAKKLEIVILAAAGRFDNKVAEQLCSLLNPANLAIMIPVVTVWAVSHFFIAGEVIDIIALLLGIAAFGMVAVSAADRLIRFGQLTYAPKTYDDLELAADYLAEAVALITVEGVLAVLLTRAPKAFREPYKKPVRMPTEGPRSPGSTWRYKPIEIESGSLEPWRHGKTTRWGDIWVNSRLGATDKLVALFHERVHSFFTPKAYLLRNVRVYLRMESYNRSYVLRYIEEALAQLYGLLRADGIKPSSIMGGISFPVENGYVTIAGIGTEISAAILGPLNFVGFSAIAYYSLEAPK